MREPDKWLVSVPTHRPSQQMAQEPRQACFPLMDPTPGAAPSEERLE